MNYKTVEVDLENGCIRPTGAEPLPAHAHGLLTILEPNGDNPARVRHQGVAGLRRFLAGTDFPLTSEQFQASIEADPYDQ